jgi:hypothetical protein
MRCTVLLAALPMLLQAQANAQEKAQTTAAVKERIEPRAIKHHYCPLKIMKGLPSRPFFIACRLSQQTG